MTIRLRSSDAIEQYLFPIALIGASVLLTELVLLRIITRTAIHIPGLGSVAIGYQSVSELGRVAFGAGIVLVGALIAAIVVDQSRQHRTWVASVFALFLLTVAFGAMGLVPGSVIDLVTIACVLVVPPLLFMNAPQRWSRLWLSPILLAMAFVIAGLPTVVDTMGSAIVMPVIGMSESAEALAIVGGIALLAGRVRSVSRRSMTYAVVAAFSVLVGLTTQPAAVETLMLWNFGLAGYFNPAVYALSIGCIVYAAQKAWRFGDRSVAIGIAFVAAGGIGLHSTIQSAAFLVGVAILSDHTLITPALITPALPTIDDPAPDIEPAG